MLHELHIDQPSSPVLGLIYVWFLRILAVLSFVSAITYWAALIGVTENGAMRFDLIEPHWRVVTATLCVLLPAAALGLWVNQTWGVVLWIAASAIEVAAFGIWSDLYIQKPMLIMSHAASFAFLCIILGALFMQRRRHHQ